MTRTKYNAFTMVEAMATLVITGMILIALFMLYDHTRGVSARLTTKMDDSGITSEILQRIAEDVDRLAGPGSTATIEIQNSFASGFPTAKIRIVNQIVDKANKPQILEEIIWQSTFDLATKRLTLWRCHSGLIWEDKLLDQAERADWTPNRHVFVPLCSGLSYFKIQVPQGNVVDNNNPQKNAQNPAQLNALQRSNRNRRSLQQQQLNSQNDQSQDQEIQYADSWSAGPLPPAIAVTLSFADPIENRGSGGIDVPDSAKIFRTIALDRTKKITFQYIPLDSNSTDANSAKNKDPNKSPLDKSTSDKSKMSSDTSAGSTSGGSDPFRSRPSRRSRTE